jgi:hypothetical protein
MADIPHRYEQSVPLLVASLTFRAEHRVGAT